MGSYVDSFVQRSDEQLGALFVLRPDLANPSPGNLASLAARASNATSTQRFLATCDARTLQVLEAAVLLGSLGIEISDESVSHTITGTSQPDEQVVAELTTLELAALVWREGSSLILAPSLEDVLDRFPAGFGPLSANGVATGPLPAHAPERAQSVLDTLLWGPPVARVARNLLSVIPQPNEPAANESLRWLLRNGYLELLDDSHVYLPRQTAFALRGGRTHRGMTQPPLADAPVTLTPESVQSEASRAATEAVRLVAELISVWEREPAHSLRNGGLPVREVKRLANELDVSAEDATLVAEFAFMARLVRCSDDSARDFAPTTQADWWIEQDLPHRWSLLVQGWLASARPTWQIGELGDKGTTYSPLHPELHGSWVTHLRANVLGILKQHPLVPLTHDLICEQLHWYAPRISVNRAAVTGILAEAAFLGLTGAGALLPGAEDGGLAHALEFALPEPVSEIFIQGDLTGMVPGRPSTALESLLEASSIVESRGGALTVRFTPDSITRAFDSGFGANELIEDLAAFSVTELPQPLLYLISDVARRHGQIRVGALSSYIRLADESTAQAVLALPTAASVGLFPIAPTILGASAPVSAVLSILREAGLAPAIEGPDGQIVAADRQSERVRLADRRVQAIHDAQSGVASTFGGELALKDVRTALPGRRSVPSVMSGATAELVASIRGASLASGSASASPSGASPADVIWPLDGIAVEVAGRNNSDSPVVEGQGPRGAGNATTPPPVGPDAEEETGVIVVNLREAISKALVVDVAMADSRGQLTHRTLKPLLLESGRLRALDPERESELTIAIHRIAAVTPL
ncbi:helicase-associated domain-containing protein [Populibacterium corticicola]